MNILEEIKARINDFKARNAQTIHDGDWSTLGRNVAFVIAMLMVAIAFAVGVLALVGKVLGTLLGKIFATPLAVFIGLLILRQYLQTEQKERGVPLPPPPEETYEYVRDALFLVFRAVSEYTPSLVMPARPSAIEFVDAPYTIEDGYVVYNFMAKTCGPIDTSQLKSDLARTLQQMQRAHELNGIPRDLVEINGGYYCPLQIFGKPQDMGEYVRIAVVFATEETIKLTLCQRTLNLDHIHHTRGTRGKNLTDDEL